MTSKYRIPAPLQNTIDNLAFLAGTQEGEKLYFKEKTMYLTINNLLSDKLFSIN